MGFGTLNLLGPWPSGKASPLHGEDRRFESGRVHHTGTQQPNLDRLMLLAIMRP